MKRRGMYFYLGLLWYIAEVRLDLQKGKMSIKTKELNKVSHIALLLFMRVSKTTQSKC